MYPVDSVIHPLNNWGLAFSEQPDGNLAKTTMKLKMITKLLLCLFCLQRGGHGETAFLKG